MLVANVDDPVDLPSRRRRLRPKSLADGTAGYILIVLILVFLLVWEMASRGGLVNPLFISRPTAIAAAYPELLADAAVRASLATTGSAMFQAFLLGAFVGVVLGYVIGLSQLLRDALYNPCLYFLSVPSSIFLPIFLLVFGINFRTAVYFGAFASFIYVLINVIGGLDLVERRHTTVVDAFGASKWQRLFHVIIPASLPGIFTGMWYAIKTALQAVLILELFISIGGVGDPIRDNSNQLRSDRVFALILGLAALSVAAGWLWTRIELRLTRWRAPSATRT